MTARSDSSPDFRRPCGAVSAFILLVVALLVVGHLIVSIISTARSTRHTADDVRAIRRLLEARSDSSGPEWLKDVPGLKDGSGS